MLHFFSSKVHSSKKCVIDLNFFLEKKSSNINVSTYGIS